MAELTRELRKQADLCRNAAAEIERLELGEVIKQTEIEKHLLRERDALRDALREIRDEPKGTWSGEPDDPCVPSKEYYKSVIEWCQDRARKVLGDTDA